MSITNYWSIAFVLYILRAKNIYMSRFLEKYWIFSKKYINKLDSNNCMDSKDSAILRLLKKDARLSIRDIAKKTSIRPSTVHQRITKLRKEGVIEKFTVKLNNEAVGESFIVFVLIKTKPSAMLDKIVSDDHVKEVFGVTGEYDLMLKMKFKDVVEFNDFILKFRKEQAIINTLTMVATANVKEEI